MNGKYLLIPPLDEEILSLEYIGTHEAAFLLTEWPTINGEAYYPSPMNPFDSNNYGLRFKTLYEGLEKSIVDQELPARLYTAIRGVSYQIRPWDALVWALLSGIILPERLQSKLGFYQFTPKAWPREKEALINKIIFQLIFVDAPDSELKDFIEHPWIQKRGYCDGENKALKRHLAEATGYKATKGRKESRVPLAISPLKEVLQDDGSYHVEGLKVAVVLVSQLVFDRMDKTQLDEITLDVFTQTIVTHPVVSLYMENPPVIILKFIRRLCSNFVGKTHVVYL